VLTEKKVYSCNFRRYIITADSENAYLFSVNFQGGYNLRVALSCIKSCFFLLNRHCTLYV